ncbi:MAG: outer membrane receptor for ferrienterochelin and colicins [Litorivivens sp.]|jgi:outer membrane receptor for ferrienterochelin and colicins
MKLRLVTTLLFMLVYCNLSFGQNGMIHGSISLDNNKQEFANISISTDPVQGSVTDSKGHFHIDKIAFGTYTVTASFVGYTKVTKTVTLSEINPKLELKFNLNESLNLLNEIVVTGTKTYKRQTNSPVIVGVINGGTLDNVQACNLSEGLKFQPGLRVETDCQTCNYTQLRMNGLGGGYSQILVNGRPIFSPLTGLYGLEQLPTNMIERIEVVRGGGSSLYGSSAIGGTVNVITKVPQKNSYELNSFYQNINGKADDIVLSGNASLVSEQRNSGVAFFFNHRERDWYDDNDDNYSELPKLENTSFGTNLFFLPNENQKLEISLSNLNEYRYGGEMVSKPAFLTQQSEDRTTNVWMGSADYQINFNDDNSSFITYAAWQNTKRKHYTGIIPEEEPEIQAHLENPPYGTSDVTTLQGGFQVNHKVYDFISGTNTFTLGAEYVYDDVFDDIPAYNYLIDQTTRNFGSFLQSDWEISRSFTLLSGVRLDQHNLIDDLVFNPRMSLLYKYKSNTQFRVSYGTGFRAPQAFDTDLHIAFAGGGVSRVILSPDLIPEKSQSYSASINYDKPMEHYIVGFTLEGFYTRLNEAFFLQPIGQDEFGELFEKQNGQGATVQGVTLELRANFDKKVQLETGLTLQASEYDDKVEYIDGIEGIREFTRTPNDYGYATLSITPISKVNVNLNYVYTGKMIMPHFAGAPNQLVDEMYTSSPFSELSTKIGYTFGIDKMQSRLELYGGVKNIFNSYQSNFDIGKNRDSNFVYGAALPRTFFIGIKLMSK